MFGEILERLSQRFGPDAIAAYLGTVLPGLLSAIIVMVVFILIWLGATRLQVAATCLGRAERALAHSIDYAAQRQQFGQQIGKFQGVSFKLADMATELKAANLLTFEAGWKYDAGTVTDEDMAMAKLKATEMLAFVADEAIQIHGGMGLMDDLPLERIWRDARVERIWEGPSEIQRHIISRALLRAVGG